MRILTDTRLAPFVGGIGRILSKLRQLMGKPVSRDRQVVTGGSCEPPVMYRGVFGYKDEAGVRHPLF